MARAKKNEDQENPMAEVELPQAQKDEHGHYILLDKDSDAPFGYEDDKPVIPYGLKADGSIRLTNKGRRPGATASSKPRATRAAVPKDARARYQEAYKAVLAAMGKLDDARDAYVAQLVEETGGDEDTIRAHILKKEAEDS